MIRLIETAILVLQIVKFISNLAIITKKKNIKKKS